MSPPFAVNGHSCFSKRALVKATFEAPTAIQNDVFDASKSVLTEALLRKRYLPCQGFASGVAVLEILK